MFQYSLQQKHKEKPYTKIVTPSDKATTKISILGTTKSTATSSSTQKSTEKSVFVTKIASTTTERNPTSLTTTKEGKHTEFYAEVTDFVTTPQEHSTEKLLSRETIWITRGTSEKPKPVTRTTQLPSTTEKDKISEHIAENDTLSKIINTIFTLDSSKWTKPSSISFSTSPPTTLQETSTNYWSSDGASEDYDDITTEQVAQNRSSHEKGTTRYKDHKRETVRSDVTEQTSVGDLTDDMSGKDTTVHDAADSTTFDDLNVTSEYGGTTEDSDATVKYSAQSRGVLHVSSSIVSKHTHESTTGTTLSNTISQRPTTMMTTTTTPVHIHAAKKSLPPANKSEPACSTNGCKSAVSRMLHLMDHSADPCENFYEFSCGEAQEDNADSHKLNYLSWQLDRVDKKSPEFLRKAKQFHESCLGYDDVDYASRVKAGESLTWSTRSPASSFQFPLSDSLIFL